MNRERVKGSDYPTQRQKGTEEMTKGIPLGVKAQEEGSPSTQGPGFCRSKVLAWLSGLPACPHNTRPPSCGPLGWSSEHSTRTRLQCGTLLGKGDAGPDAKAANPQDCSPDGGEGWYGCAHHGHLWRPLPQV